ncbi:MAG: hypothetical protein ACJAQW_001535 [Paracoccaceae bacterium]|jgi:hypothetical protein
MSVTENIGLRTFDLRDAAPDSCGRTRFWLSGRKMRRDAAELVRAFKIRTVSLDVPTACL